MKLLKIMSHADWVASQSYVLNLKQQIADLTAQNNKLLIDNAKQAEELEYINEHKVLNQQELLRRLYKYELEACTSEALLEEALKLIKDIEVAQTEQIFTQTLLDITV